MFWRLEASLLIAKNQEHPRGAAEVGGLARKLVAGGLATFTTNRLLLNGLAELRRVFCSNEGACVRVTYAKLTFGSRFFTQVLVGRAKEECIVDWSRPFVIDFGAAAPRAIAKCFDRRIDPVRLKSVLLNIAKIFGLFLIVIAFSASPRSFAAEQASDVPAWLRAYVDEGEGLIAQVVLQRARALYLQKVSEGAVKNPCYFAMDATRPHDLSDGKLGQRFYVICESGRTFRAISAGHGGGRDLKGIANFANGKRCAKNFGNALDSRLTAGGAYVTAETKTSFKGYYRASAKQDAVLIRSFVQFDGEGEPANARQREIGGHPAELLRNVCLRKDPHSSYADRDGYVPFGQLEDYAGGRSNGCTSWSPPDAGQIIAMVKDDPTTLYIYPESADIDAIMQAVKAGRSLSRAGQYWNASCLKEIGSPKFWSQKILEPVLAQYNKHHPAPPQRPPPICKGQ